MKSFSTALLFVGVALAAYGDSVTFTFDKAGSIAALSPGATNSAIATYMTSVLQAAGCIGCTVGVKDGASGTVYVDNTYTGDSHVVGPSGNPVTLGTTEGAQDNTDKNGTADRTTDNFLSNVSNTPSSGGNQIDLTFTLPTGYKLSGTVSFDYEIFPDAGCPGGTGGCPTLPTFEFEVGGSPFAGFGSSGIVDAVAPGTTNGGSTLNGSTTQTAYQYIGTSGNLNLGSGGYTALEFIDWPAAIGVDNLTVNFSTPVPETSSVLLLGTLSLMLIPLVRRARKA